MVILFLRLLSSLNIELQFPLKGPIVLKDDRENFDFLQQTFVQKNREMQRGIVSCVAYRENTSLALDERGCEQSKLTSYSKESRGRCNSRHIFGRTAVNASVMRTDSCYLKNRTIERCRISILMPTNPWDWKSASYTLHENRVSFIDNQV